MSTKSPRERDIGFSQEKPAHEAAPIQREAIANNTEYGLTGSVYTTGEDKIERAKREFHVGNLYINRKCTGAVVGANPFGGFNMSGTDSKAGGTDYLYLFSQAKSIEQAEAEGPAGGRLGFAGLAEVEELDAAEGNLDEPGDCPDAPYKRQHCVATGVERIMAAMLGVDWKAYEDDCNADKK